MAVRTYIPGLKTAVKGIKGFVSRYHEKLETYIGGGLMTLVDFLLDICEILLAVIESNSDAIGNYQAPMDDALNSSLINEVQGAFNKFLDANGAGGA